MRNPHVDEPGSPRQLAAVLAIALFALIWMPESPAIGQLFSSTAASISCVHQDEQ
jgi:hypothetical protein